MVTVKFPVRISSLFLLLVLLSSCSSDSYDTAAQLKVFKYDSSIQCGDEGIAESVMRQELVDAGIDVICSQKGHDGLVRPMVCGAETGNINIYTIYAASLSDAEASGFQSVDVLEEYQDEPCL